MTGVSELTEPLRQMNILEEFQNPLKRLDDTIFSFSLNNEGGEEDEVRVQTPFFGESAINKSHALALHFFSACKGMTRAQIEAVKRIDIRDNDEDLCRSWNVAKVADSLWARHTSQTIPMLRKIHDRRVLHLSLSPQGNVLSRSISYWKGGSVLQSLQTMEYQLRLEEELLPESIEKRLDMAAYSDPFTRLAIRAFEVYEPRFVSQVHAQGALRYIVRDNMLALVPALSGDENAEEQNRAVLALYREFVLEEYGHEYLAYVEMAYGFCLEDMIQKATPLYPDHVFKVNVGVNNIELRHVEGLYEKLNSFVHSHKKSPGDTYRECIFSMREAGFSFREMRTLEALFCEKYRVLTIASFWDFLQTLVGKEKASQEAFRRLPAESINVLISVLMPHKGNLDNLFTGRRITHLAICGYHTMGDSSVTDPCRDLFELLHIFPSLGKKEAESVGDDSETWYHWKELLAHVAVKKTLIRKYYKNSPSGHEDIIWRVGTILPAPKSRNKSQRWYYVASALDDDDGNVNYVLLPVSDHYRTAEGKPLPAVKLYRSTASNKNAYDSYDSLAADLNPHGGPGSLDPLRGFPFERGFFDQRTIPVWMGYCIQAQSINVDKEGGAAERVKALRNALKEYVDYLKCLEYERDDEQGINEVAALLTDAKSKRDSEVLDVGKMLQFLAEKARELGEHPEQKIAQDIVFVGHSLGGSLAQFGFYFWGADSNRIPLPQHNFECFSLDAPAITPGQDKTVRGFTKKHADLLEALGQKWKIWYQFEYGDIVPQAGERHLGTSKGYPEKCVQVFARVFRPSEVSHALEITSLPTHGRRIGLARENSDYTLTAVDARSLRKFHGMRLPSELNEIFGYKYLTSAKMTDVVRRLAGVPLIPILQIFERLHERGRELPGHREGTEVFFAAIDDPQVDVVQT